MWASIYAKIKARAKGIRTFLAAAAFGLTGALNVIGTVDLAPLLRLYIPDEKQIGAVLVVLAIAFALLRCITTTPPGGAPDQVAPVKPGVDAGA